MCAELKRKSTEPNYVGFAKSYSAHAQTRYSGCRRDGWVAVPSRRGFVDPHCLLLRRRRPAPRPPRRLHFLRPPVAKGAWLPFVRTAPAWVLLPACDPLYAPAELTSLPATINTRFLYVCERNAPPANTFLPVASGMK